MVPFINAEVFKILFKQSGIRRSQPCVEDFHVPGREVGHTGPQREDVLKEAVVFVEPPGNGKAPRIQMEVEEQVPAIEKKEALTVVQPAPHFRSVKFQHVVARRAELLCHRMTKIFLGRNPAHIRLHESSFKLPQLS